MRLWLFTSILLSKNNGHSLSPAWLHYEHVHRIVREQGCTPVSCLAHALALAADALTGSMASRRQLWRLPAESGWLLLG